MRSSRFDGLLLSRFAILNLLGFAGLALAWHAGLVGTIWTADTSGISAAIAALFAVGLACAGYRIVKVGAEIDRARRGELRAEWTDAEAIKLRLFARNAYIRHIANALVLLGLIGTVWGFLMALANVDAERASDVGQITPMVGDLIGGMGVALYTTLVGSVLNLWLGAAHQMLSTGTANLAALLIEQRRRG